MQEQVMVMRPLPPMMMMMMLLQPILLLLLGSAACGEARMPSMEQFFSHDELVRIAGYGDERLSSVFVTGFLSCDVCLLPGAHLLSFPVPGAKIAAICKTEDSEKKTDAEFVTTNYNGEFTIDLPSRLHAIPSLQEDCTVKVVEIPTDSYCQVHLFSNSHKIQLSLAQDGVRVYTTGVIRLNHNSSTPSENCVKTDEDAWARVRSLVKNIDPHSL